MRKAMWSGPHIITADSASVLVNLVIGQQERNQIMEMESSYMWATRILIFAYMAVMFSKV